MTRPEQELLSRYLLARLLEDSRRAAEVGERRQDQDQAPSIVYPQLTRPLRKLLERAKQSIDVIDFRSSQPQVSQSYCPEEKRGEERRFPLLCCSLAGNT